MGTDSPLASSEWASFIAAMQREPGDDTTRLVAADWLQDTGRPELVAWAEFIRLAVQQKYLVRAHVFHDSCDCTPCRNERRIVSLHDRWSMYWLPCHTMASLALARFGGVWGDPVA